MFTIRLRGLRLSRTVHNLVTFGLVFFCHPASTRAQLIVDVVHFDLRTDEVEGLDVSSDGSLVLGTGPILMPELGNGQETFQSEMALLALAGTTGMPLGNLPTIQLGPGEVTDGAIGPGLAYFVVNVRADDVFARNQLLLTGPRGGLRDKVDLPGSADGIGQSPDGRYVLVAGEKYEAIDVFTVVRHETSSARSQNRSLELVTTIDRADFEPFFVGEEGRIADADIEPEAITFTPDGSLAFVSLQEQSSIAVVDMDTLSLVNVVHLPFGFLVDLSDDGEEPEFEVVGVSPDGMGIAPDGSFLIAANEADGDYPHLAGLSIVDLRSGPVAIPAPTTHCIFDIDPTLLDGSGVATCPILAPGEEPSADETAAIRSLPRLDPNAVKIVHRTERLVAAVNIERPPEDEDRGSVLFLDVSDALDGSAPAVFTRVNVGLHPGARPEGLKTSNGGAYVWVGLQLDGGTVTRFQLAE